MVWNVNEELIMEWYVYVFDINTRKIKEHNVFNHYDFRKACAKIAKKIKDREEFEQQIKSELMYYYWSKCEWEVVVDSFPPYGKPEKIDVYDQIMLNFDRFIDYVWRSRKALAEYAEKKR